jgi:polysaccharide biosynthesis protein PslG
MKKNTVLFFALFAIFSFETNPVVAFTPLPGNKAGVKTDLPSKVIPMGLGFNVHIKGPDTDWDNIRASGARFIRADFAWGGIERNKGEYNFDAYDRMLESLTARGIRALFILDYRNNLYTNPENTDEGREAFARWAAASAAHFKGRNVMWEIWNEPNVGFWKGTGKLNSNEFADQYVALVKKTVPAMRVADPDCYILGGSVSCLWRDSFRWIDQAFKQGLLASGINALSVHPYGYPRPELCMEGGIPGEEGYVLLREKMEKAGAPGNFPVVNTEVGYSSKEKGVLRGDSAQDQRAMLFVRTYMVDQMCDIRTTIWYNWDENDAETHRVRSSSKEPMPIYNACKNMNAELTGYHYVERLKVGTAQDYIAVFENTSKGRKIVAWTTPKGRIETQDKAVAHEVTISTKGGKGVVVVRDLYGKTVQAKIVDKTVTLTLTASPQYIDLSGKPVTNPGL